LFILEFNDSSTRHWGETWRAAGSGANWISDGLIYHEGCAVSVGGDEIKLWDASATWWIDPKQFGGYGGLLALRVFDAAAATPTTFGWGEHCIPARYKVPRAETGSPAPLPAREIHPEQRIHSGKKASTL
jgi:hypothetical protein